jgi:hypothetical protein
VSAEFAATVASAELSMRHVAGVEERKRMVVNQAAKSREMCRAIRGSDGKGLGSTRVCRENIF